MNSLTFTTRHGETATISLGDYVGFKSDIEQAGKVTAISNDGWLTLENDNGFDGAYLAGSTTTRELASDCWID